MSKLIQKPILSLHNQLDKLHAGVLIAVYTEGVSFAGEQVFVIPVSEFTGDNEWTDVLNEATHWDFVDNLTFIDGCPVITGDSDEGAPVLVKYRKDGHIHYQQMELGFFCNWNHDPEGDELGLFQHNMLGYVLL